MSGAEEATISLPSSSSRVLVAFGFVWVAGTGNDELYRIDPATNQIAATVELRARPTALAAGEGAIWVFNEGDGTVQRIDGKSGQQLATLETSTLLDGPESPSAGALSGSARLAGLSYRLIRARIRSRANSRPRSVVILPSATVATRFGCAGKQHTELRLRGDGSRTRPRPAQQFGFAAHAREPGHQGGERTAWQAVLFAFHDVSGDHRGVAHDIGRQDAGETPPPGMLKDHSDLDSSP